MDYRWDSLGETGAGQDAERRLAESIRVKASEFEREREAYIEAAKQLLLQDLSKTGVGGREDGRGVRSRLAGRGQEEDKENVCEINGNIVHRNPPSSAPAAAKSEMEAAAAAAAAAAAGAGAGAGPRQHGGKVRAAPSLRQAREERRAASEEIRVLQQRKADAAVRLQGERLSNLEQGLELGVLRLERLLDRERILELLRLTDPNRPAGPAAAAATADEEGAEVSEELIGELEERVEEAEERVRAEAAKLGATMAGRLGDRAKREEGFRTEAVEARDDVLRLQSALRVKEDRLAQTVVDYLELRHAMLRVQQASSVAREDAAAERIVQEEEVQECRRSTAEQTKAVAEQVARTCEEVGGELRRQIQLREDEACMLQEQRAEAEELYEARAVRLEELLEEWKAKYSALRRKFALETEGFRRDADNIGRRFERIRAGPPGGRPSISSRGGSSAKHAVEHAMYSRPNMASAAPGRPAVGEAGAGRGGRGGRVGAMAAAEAAYSSSSFGGRRRGGV